jgi:hypothetical protein
LIKFAQRGAARFADFFGKGGDSARIFAQMRNSAAQRAGADSE